METQKLVESWFKHWVEGSYLQIPITDDFTHISPFGKIIGKSNYLNLVQQNEDKFLGQTFELHDAMYSDDCACVRYTARQAPDFSLDVSEWYYFENRLIKKIIAYYHIGEIRNERTLKSHE